MTVEFAVRVIHGRAFRHIIDLCQIELRRALLVSLIKNNAADGAAQRQQREQCRTPSEEVQDASHALHISIKSIVSAEPCAACLMVQSEPLTARRVGRSGSKFHSKAVRAMVTTSIIFVETNRSFGTAQCRSAGTSPCTRRSPFQQRSC